MPIVFWIFMGAAIDSATSSAMWSSGIVEFNPTLLVIKAVLFFGTCATWAAAKASQNDQEESQIEHNDQEGG